MAQALELTRLFNSSSHDQNAPKVSDCAESFGKYVILTGKFYQRQGLWLVHVRGRSGAG